MTDHSGVASAAIRAALPVLRRDDFDELEDVVELVMTVNVPIPAQHREDVKTYLTAIWVLTAAAEGELLVDERTRTLMGDHARSAIARLRAAGVAELAFEVQQEVEASGVWQLPNRSSAEALLDTLE